ncbi:hypothetical protein ABT115_08880 [Streptomyces sp. NPDC001832]|uniref:hypothetical protein n=1 Tax=Streptomyces sp. NPDC001832 TaxID=3154527 RepID=UPI00331752EA
MPKFFKHPPKNVQLGRAVRKWGQPPIPGRYRVTEAIGGSVTPGRTLSRFGAIRVFQHYVKGI